MREYVLAAYKNKSIFLDLNQVKKLHGDYIRELNQLFFKNILTGTPRQITELLFRQEDYIVQWLESRASWPAVKTILPCRLMRYGQWKKAPKKVILDN